MDLYFSHLAFAFIEGLGLVVSPCILPILPIMLAASLDGGKARPLGIIAGFILAFTVFALLSRQILAALHVDPEIVRDVALVLLVLFGLVMLSKTLSDKLLGATQGLANFGQNVAARWDRKQGFFGGVGVGALIGLIWTPCAGPIMAAAIVQIIEAKTSLEAQLTVVLFACGAGLPMLAIALLGRQIMGRLSFLKTHAYAVRRVLGVVIIAAAALIYSGADVQLLAASGGAAPVAASGNGLQRGLDHPYPAPEIAGIRDWVNSPPLKIADLKGKVVLVDFWTYSCINCVRTLPYVTGWDAKYRDKGLVVIGVHSPEFEFEKKLDNVRMATEKYGIHYPVALDSDLQTWESFSNQYWPAHYLIDKNGQVVYTHFGEGDYDVTENNIRVLLGLGPETARAAPEMPNFAAMVETPETYLGYARAQNFASEGGEQHDQSASYRFPSVLLLNQWALGGEWRIEAEKIATSATFATTKTVSPALRLNFIARKVFLVLGTEDSKPRKVRVWLNGQPSGSAGGADVKGGVLTVDHERLYELIDQGSVKNGQLELQTDDPGLQAYAFTFGG
jgi:cytochrome c biogenesis protein CcdA/thiol-disulfide isomerase/thioredoxin